MRRIRVNMQEVVAAFDGGDGMYFYLDLETGEVALVTDEMHRELEELESDLADAEGIPSDAIPAAADEAGLSSWMQDAVLDALAVEEGYGTRYIEVPRVETCEAYQDMERFIATIGNPRLQDHLARAISGRGAFRRFKDALLDYPEERERWFVFRDEQMWRRVLEWLESEEIEPIFE